MILTFKFRIKDATTGKYLDRHARAVNFVWNYCCETQRKSDSNYKAGALNGHWPSHFDLVKLTTGCSLELNLHSDTINQVCKQFVISRNKTKRCPRFRASSGPKRSLGWIPFVGRAVKLDNACVMYLRRKFRFWKSRDFSEETIKSTSCFTQDARGRWYVCFQCEVENNLPIGCGKVGIDLGLKTLATCSNDDKIPTFNHYRKYEVALATAQRSRNKKRIQAIHAKIANSRRDQLHKASAKIARENQLIVVGNVSAAKLVKTKMAKSVLDVGWSMFRSMLEYKARRHQACYIEVDERFTSQTCSCCGTIPDSSPKGMGALGIRHWTCSGCGTFHDRDVNAAKNILRVGLEHQPPAEGIPKCGEDVILRHRCRSTVDESSLLGRRTRSPRQALPGTKVVPL
jgi:IS605 OrfB family transposase